MSIRADAAYLNTGGPTTHPPYSQTLVGVVGPLGYTGHSVSSPSEGIATVELAWCSEDARLALSILRAPDAASDLQRRVPIAVSDAHSTRRREVSFGVGARELFEVLVDSHAVSTQAYVITVTVS